MAPRTQHGPRPCTSLPQSSTSSMWSSTKTVGEVASGLPAGLPASPACAAGLPFFEPPWPLFERQVEMRALSIFSVGGWIVFHRCGCDLRRR